MSTCIICGEPAGSGEHVFPASLGGRRTNKNIYCTLHDNGYGGLVGILAWQLSSFNSILGVLGDHDKKPRTLLATDLESGLAVRLSADKSSFTETRVISSTAIDGGIHQELAFPDKAAIDRYVDEQKAAGNNVEFLSKQKSRSFFLSDAHAQPHFGGALGLAAIAYVAQTFLAQEFSEVARSPALADFKRYTIANALDAANGRRESSWMEEVPIWWDFDPAADKKPNHFPFGHQVVVGVAADGSIFGRMSFFSALRFAMVFGRGSPPTEPRAVMVDIDPLAEHPPNDIVKSALGASVSAPERPANERERLRARSGDGGTAALLNELVGRMVEYEARKSAAKLYTRIAKLVGLPAEQRVAGLARELAPHSQRIWNRAREAVLGFAATPMGAAAARSIGDLSALVAHDSSKPNGLSDKACMSLKQACDAIERQMLEDQSAGSLDEQRIYELLATGEGTAVVGAAIIHPYIDTAPILRR